MNYWFQVLVLFLFGLVCTFLFSLLLAWPVELLWNSTLTDVFGFKIIGFWQAWGILMLSGLLFGSSNQTKENRS